MSKILGIKLNQQLGILAVQEVQFVQDNEGLIVIKGNVGSGKSTVGAAVTIGLAAGSEREIPLDMKKYQGLDIEECISYGDTPIYLHTIYSDGKLTSSLYILDKDGKKSTNPIIGGKKMTPAVLRDILRTQLTFGVDQFISENPRTQMEFMMGVYKDKLREKGVIFDKSAPAYQGSILWRLEQAKMERTRIFSRVAELNARKNRLEEEGYDEKNIPLFVDIDSIEKEKQESVKAYYQSISDIDGKINVAKVKASEYNGIIKSYNDNLDTQRELAQAKENEEVRVYNQKVIAYNENLKKISTAVNFLIENGCDLPLIQWEKSLHGEKELREAKVIQPINKIETNEKGVYIYREGLPEEVSKAFKSLSDLRTEVLGYMKEKEALKEPEDTYTDRIEKAKRTNLIAKRWATFYEHQEADKLVKDTLNEYKKIFTSIDLGVDGLRMEIIGDEDSTEIRTTYNGVHNIEFFGNEKKEYRNIASYSLTQRNVLSILMQIYLLDEKRKNGEEGLRYLFLEAPMDLKTRDLILEYQKKHDLQILVSATGDYTQDSLIDGEYLIDGGYLLSKKL